MPEEEVVAAPAPEGLGESGGIDVESTVDSIALDLHLDPVGEAEASLAAAAEQGKAAPPPEAPLEAQAPPGAAADPNNQAPDTWTKGSKEKWATIPPDIQAEIRKREGDIANYVAGTKNNVAISKKFEAVFEPFVPYFNATGANPWDVTAGLLQAHVIMNRGTPQQKLQAFASLAQGAGIDLRAFAQGNADAATNNPAFAEIQRLNKEISDLRGGVNSVTSHIQAARAAELEQNVLAFAQDTATHPHFWDVAGEIQQYIEKGAATTLQQAYDLAVMANPITRQKVIDAEATKRNANLMQLEDARAAKAKKAAAVNVKARGHGRAAPAVGTIDDTLTEALADIKARG